MKRLIQLVLCVVIGFIGNGLYLQSIKGERAEFYIGVGVLILAFILMPLFIYHRYKGKDLTQYSFKNMQGPEDKEPS